jgi:DDE superfamily endonuclease
MPQAALEQMPTLTDLGYENLSPAIRHPVKKPKGGALTDEQTAYNRILRGVHRITERANSLLKTTFKALRHVSLCPWRIGPITQAALVVLHLEHHRPIPGSHTA